MRYEFPTLEHIGDALSLVRDHVLREGQSGPRLEAARRLFGARRERPALYG